MDSWIVNINFKATNHNWTVLSYGLDQQII